MFDFLKKKETFSATLRTLGSVYSQAHSGDTIILQEQTDMSELQMSKAVDEALYKYQKIVKMSGLEKISGGWQMKLAKV